MFEEKTKLGVLMITVFLVLSIFSVSVVQSGDDSIYTNLCIDESRSCDILNEDTRDESIAERSEYPFPDHYPSVQELYDWYDDLVIEFPELVSKIHIGNSYEGRDLWVLEITSDEDVQVDDKPEILIDAIMHSREWSGPQVASYLTWRMLNEYETNETIYWLLNNRRIFVMPIQNPDGYIYDGDGVYEERSGWRKNTNDSTPTTSIGVDLNRNWDIAWEQGVSDPSSDTYRGEAPFSEYENKYLRDFMLSNDIQSYQNIHSHHHSLLIPYMHTSSPSPHDDWFRGMAGHMTSQTSRLGDDSSQYVYGQPHELIGYSAPGGAADWAYDALGAHGLVYEIYTGGWGMEGFYPHPDEIMTINQDVDDSLIYQCRVADTDLGDGDVTLYPPVPYLVYGTVGYDGGGHAEGVTVSIENMETGETISIDTDRNGYYELNFGNLVEEGYELDDDFRIYTETYSEDFSISDEWGQRIDIEIIAGEPPEISVTQPSGGETFDAGTQETISWSTTPGDNPVDHINLEYSVDAGSNWQTIDTNVADTGSYTWTVPNEHSSDCLVRVEAVDTAGRRGDDESASTFTIVGTPPAPPDNLEVQHTGGDTAILFQDDVSADKGYTTDVSGSASGSEWDIRQHGSSVGSNSWDFGDGQYHKSSGAGYISMLTSPAIEIPAEATEVELSFDHWRDLGFVTTMVDGGNLKLSTNGVNGNFDLITPNEGYDGEINDGFGNPLGGEPAWGSSVDWETVTFDLSAHAGDTIHLRWEAGIEEYDEDFGAGWRIDNVLVTAEGIPSEGDDHNLISWDASPDELTGDVSHYNIYRSESQSGPWDESTFVESVTADGSADYEHLDHDKGMSDDIFWWYVVRAVGTNGLEEDNENAVQEPGTETTTMDIQLTADADGWNFVSFNLIPDDTSLEAILEDPDNGIAGNYDKVMYFDSGSWYSYVPDRADHFNNLGTWDHTMGVWVQMNVEDTLTVEGIEPGTTTLTLEPGWNMVGLPSDSAGHHDLPTEVTTVGYFEATEEYNVAYVDSQGFEFSPGSGYWLYNDADENVEWTVDY